MTVTQAARDEASLRPRERWGYGLWLFTGGVIAVPELWAASGATRWPTISATVGHLEKLWSPVKIIVVALIAAGAAQALANPVQDGERRTPAGRLMRGTRQSAEVVSYFPAATLTSATFTIGYVLYGLIALGFGIVPNALGYWFAKDVPFPPLLRTLADLDRRWYPADLAAYPWP